MFAITNPVLDPKIGNTATTPAGESAVFIVKLFLVNFLRLGFVVESVIFLFMLLSGALEYITAGGDKDKTGAAAKRITNAIVGIVLLFSLFAISRIVSIVFGINLLEFEVPKI